MKCPYCEQDHPAGTEICPTTGRSLVELGQAEPSQEDQMASPPQLVVPTPSEDPLDKAQTSGAGIGDLQQHDSAESLDGVSSQPVLLAPAEVSAEAQRSVRATKRGHVVPWILGGCIGLPLLIILLLALGIFLDPFNLHITGRITGQYDAAAEVMPADTGLYLGINIANGYLTGIDHVIVPFLPANESSSRLGFMPARIYPTQARQASPFDDLLQQIEDETGIKVPDDITPWIGQYAGIGAVEFDATANGSPVPAGFIIAIEARNLTHADAFLAKLQSNMTEMQDAAFEQQTYQGVKLYAEKVNGDQAGISFGRSGRMVMIASSLDVLKKAIDQQAGQSLSAEQGYADLAKVRTHDWTASFYINYDWMRSYIEDMMASSPSTASPLVSPYMNWPELLISLSAIKQGARLDMYMNVDETLQGTANPNQIQSLFATSPQVLEILPEDTVLYLASDRFNIFLESFVKASYPNDIDTSDFWGSLDQMLGFSLKEDLVDHLTGQWSLYVVPSTRGLLPTQADLNLAVSLLVQTNGELDLQPVTSGLNLSALESGLTLNENERDGFTYYELNLLGTSDPMLSFGAGNGYFTLGTDSETLRLSPTSENLLVKSDNYQTAIQALPTGMQPTIYFDLENLLANLREGIDASDRDEFNASVSAIDPIRVIVLGGRPLNGGIFQSSIAIILDNQ